MKVIKSMVLFILMLNTAVHAAEIIKVEVDRIDSGFLVYFEAILDAPVEKIFSQFIKYNQLPIINPSIRESTILGRYGERIHRLRVITELCIFIFCKDILHIQDMVQHSSKYIVTATIVPEVGDFKTGQAKWVFKRENFSTRLIFSGQLEPDFWVPPLIGSWAVKRMLRTEIMQTSMGLERVVKDANDN